MDSGDSLSTEEPQGGSISDLEGPYRQCRVSGVDGLEARVNTSGRPHTWSSKGRLGHGVVLALAVERCGTENYRVYE